VNANIGDSGCRLGRSYSRSRSRSFTIRRGAECVPSYKMLSRQIVLVSSKPQYVSAARIRLPCDPVSALLSSRLSTPELWTARDVERLREFLVGWVFVGQPAGVSGVLRV